MRLVVICDIDGVPVGYDLVGPKTGQERESALHLAAGHPGSLLFADKGLWGKELDASMDLINVRLITPERHQLSKRPPAEITKARIRLVIESVFSNLKRQMRLEQHLAKTIAGLVQRIRPATARADTRHVPQRAPRPPTGLPPVQTTL
jgi:hypothetical protein